MMLVLKQDVSIAFFNLKDDVGGIMTSIGEQNQDIQSLAQAVMSKAMVPITSTDLSEILRSAKQIWSRVVQANGQVKVLKLVTGLLDSVNDENILSSVAKTVNKVQGKIKSKYVYHKVFVKACWRVDKTWCYSPVRWAPSLTASSCARCTLTKWWQSTKMSGERYYFGSAVKRLIGEVVQSRRRPRPL